MNSFQDHKISFPNPYQMHPTCIQNPFNIQSKPVKKMRRCTLHGGAFLVQRTTFLVQRAAFGRGAASGCQKGERAGCFWSPRDEPFWSKSAKQSPGGVQKDPKIRKKAIQTSMQKMMPKKDTKCIPKAFQNYAKTDTKIFDLSYFCEKG